MRYRCVPLEVPVALILARVAIASEAPHAHDGGVPVATLIFSTINLLLFGYILARFLLPPIRGWVSERRARVVADLEDAAAAKAAAESARAEWEARLAQFDTTVAELRAQARRDAESERERILAVAHKTADAIRRDAERAAAYEVRRTQERMRAELVRQAVRLAEDTARTRWTAADQDRFVADFLKQVQQ